jgi:hypothetical protein
MINLATYIKGRNITLSARLILNIFENCYNNDQELTLLFFGFSKALGSTECNFMFEVLKRLNFG